MPTTEPSPDVAEYDIFIIGGGINGCGIARDAAGRGLRVGLAEMNDLASATSSASTKLFHGGLRYLEYFEFRLVREALREREVLLRAMPHIAWPMRFVLPYSPDMRFEGGTPASKVLTAVMPWLRNRRPGWVVRLGLLLYDALGRREILPGTRTIELATDPAGGPLKDRFRRAFEYSDCWVQDARLVVLNARDAAQRGAVIRTRTRVISANRSDGIWKVVLETDGIRSVVHARLLVNATGPWVGEVIRDIVGSNSQEGVRLVRGSHLVTRRLYEHDKCYFLQGTDGRIIFTIPYEGEFTLIGTTDEEHDDPDVPPVCTEREKRYLLDFVSQYFDRPVKDEDVVWSFSGVRPLYDDGEKSATAATRDYVLSIDREGGAPLLNVFGGKITTYRRLAEEAMDRIGDCLGHRGESWTSGAALPGGEFPVDGAEELVQALRRDYPFLTGAWALRMVRTYGTETRAIFREAATPDDLGEDFGATIHARELDWAVAHEWVRCADDFLWRRTKLGLQVTDEQATRIEAYIARIRPTAPDR